MIKSKIIKRPKRIIIKNKENKKIHCGVVDPDLKTRQLIMKSLENAMFVDNGQTIHIGIVFHVCFNGYNQVSIDLDIAHVMTVLNKDFKNNADNFDNGRAVYASVATPRYLRYYRYLRYVRRLRYIRITRRLRRNRRRFRRVLRINRRRRRLNRRRRRRRIRINRRRRRINRSRRRLNRIRRRINNARRAAYLAAVANRSRYNNYVTLAGNTNAEFHHIQTLYNPINNVTSTNLNTIDTLVKINGSPAVQTDKYLNVWIVRLDSGLLGYAQFPWDLATRPNTDGVIISQYVFGRTSSYSSYNLNKTMIHEIGHWIGLYHNFQTSFGSQQGIFDNNNDTVITSGESTGDLVNDTPPQTQPTYGNPYIRRGSWPRSSGVYHMFMDYMDYSNDINMFMFTQEQAKKGRFMMGHYRPNALLDPNNL